jgi:hypothetical protein
MIDNYLDGAQLLRRAVAGMTREQTLARPVAGKWSTLEVAAHLADFEAIDADRIKRTIALDRPTLMDGDETLFASALAYHQRDLEEEVSLVENTRRQLARILRTLPDGALDRVADYRIGDRVEQRTLRQLFDKAIRHIRHHVPFILEKRRALGLG